MSRGRKPYLGPSEAQANAEALERRGRTFADPSDASFSVAWDYHQRKPRDLADAADIIRRAYAEEVPVRLHEHDAGDDGTPRMHPAAESYIFGWAEAGYDPDKPLTDFYRTPFKAALARLYRKNPHRGSLVFRVAVGGESPIAAAVAMGILPWGARDVAERTLFGFCESMSDIKVTLAKEVEAA